MKKQALAGFLLFLMLLSGAAYPLRARAVLGVLDIDIGADEIAKWILDTLLKSIIETLRKRLLDSMVDQIITWIQGGGDPKFIQNFGDVLGDAFQAAVGDTILDTQLAPLCYEPLKFKLQISLTQPIFSQRVSCTLDDVVENIGAFKNDFKTGGWIAYQESLKPQNNPAGISLLTQDELLRKQDKKSAVTQFEATVGAGFFGDKRCKQWEKTVPEINPATGLFEPVIITLSGPGWEEAYFAETPDGVKYTGKEDKPLASLWKCTKPETITPGGIVGESVAKAVGSDLDFLMGAEGGDALARYIAAIADAAINRLTKEGVEGLAYTTRSGRETNCEELEGGVRAACITLRTLDKTKKWVLDLVLYPLKLLGIKLSTDVESYEDVEDFELFARDSLLSIIQNNDPEGKLISIEDVLLNASSTNTGLISTLNELITCQEGLDEPIDPNTTTTLAVTEERADKINQELFPQIEVLQVILQALPSRIEVVEELELENLRREVLNLISDVNDLLGEATGLETVVNSLSTQADTNLQQCQAP